MDINDILNSLGLDFSNPEVKRGAIEAIEAILASRNTSGGTGGSQGGQEIDVELDPDLIQPSIKQQPSGSDSDDIEIEDEENILDQIKHNDSDDQPENTNTNNDASDSGSNNSQNSKDTDTTSNTDKTEKPEPTTDTESSSEKDYTNTKVDGEEVESDDLSIDDSEVEANEDNDTVDADSDDNDIDGDGSGTDGDSLSSDDTDEETGFGSDEVEDPGEELDNESEEEFYFEDEDLLDDELKNSTEDDEIKTKHNARKLKRERTIAAANKALADAKAKKVAPALIRELEKAIEALEALTEAVAKSIKDISDAEFNQLINRVLDAIQACGDSSLTFTSEEERQAKVKEIKDDMASAQTQAELSAEDVAKIRAETQAVKAREKEADSYKRKSAGSFKGFQEFLNSLYRAIALQVHHEETQDDSWSAISRRNSGAGVLQQGKKIQELPNKKIPVIDFYFDQSGSWDDDDIKVGEKAVQSLAEMEANGQIKINIYYFSNEVFTDAASARALRGTGAWNDIVKNVIATQANNVIIMTDHDMENWWSPQHKPPLKYTVPGYVWYLWRDGDNAPRLPRDLKGRGGVQQFAFNTNDI